MVGRGLRFDAPRLLAVGVLLLPLSLAALVALPARPTTDFWTGLTLGPGALGVLLTAAILIPAIALTRRGLVGPFLDAVLFLGVPLLAGVTLWAASVPGSYFIVLLSLELLWIGAALVWLGRFGYVLVRRRPATGEIASWLALPVLVVATAVAVLTDGPMMARFELSRPAMDRTAQDVRQGSRDPQTIDRIGLWEVERAEKIPGGFRFLVASTGFLNPMGFAYSPRGYPTNLGEDMYTHLKGPWYVWEENW